MFLMKDVNNYKLLSEDITFNKEDLSDKILFSFDFTLPSSQKETIGNVCLTNLCSDDSGIGINSKTLTTDSENDSNFSIETCFQKDPLISDEFDNCILNCPGVSSDDEGSIKSFISGFLDMSDSEDSFNDILNISENTSSTDYFTAISSQSR